MKGRKEMKMKLSRRAKGNIFLYGYILFIFIIGFVCGGVVVWQNKTVKTQEIEQRQEIKEKAEPTEEQTEVKEDQRAEEEPPTDKEQYKEITVVATAYCPCYECSEGYGTSTSTGAKATAGRTIAVDPSVIPYGTEVIVNGHTYIAEDCGGAIKGNKIDIYFDTHAETEKFGRQTLTAKVAA